MVIACGSQLEKNKKAVCFQSFVFTKQIQELSRGDISKSTFVVAFSKCAQGLGPTYYDKRQTFHGLDVLPMRFFDLINYVVILADHDCPDLRA